MSNKEISYRVAEVCRIQADRLRCRLSVGFDRDEDLRQLTSSFQGSLKSYLESAAAPRFYSSLVPQQREATVGSGVHDAVDRAGMIHEVPPDEVASVPEAVRVLVVRNEQ